MIAGTKRAFLISGRTGVFNRRYKSGVFVFSGKRFFKSKVQNRRICVLEFEKNRSKAQNLAFCTLDYRHPK